MAERTRRIPPLTRDKDGTAICRHWDCDNPVQPPRRSWCSAECVHDALMQSNPGYARQQVHRRDKGVCAECGCDTDAIRQQLGRLKQWTHYARTNEKLADRTGIPVHQLDQVYTWAAIQRDQQRYEEAMWRYRDNPTMQARIRKPRRHTIWGKEPELPEGVDPEDAFYLKRFQDRLERFARALYKIYRRNLTAAGFDDGRRSFWDMDHITEVVRDGHYDLPNLQTLCQPCHKAKTARLARERALERRGEQALPGMD